MKRLLVIITATLLLITVDSCKKKTPQPIEVETTSGSAFYLDETMGYPGEVLTIESNINLASVSYNGTIESSAIAFYRAGKSLSFSVPNIAAGNYTVSLNIDGEPCELALQILAPIVISDPVQYLTDYMVENDAIYDANNAFIDSMVANGDLDAATAVNDAVIWNNIRQQSITELSSMTAGQKQELVELLEANKDWIDALSVTSSNNYFSLKSAECDALNQAGLDALTTGNTFEAMGIAVEYKWCKAQEFINANTNNSLSKTIAILENTEHIWAINTVGNFVGLKIKALSNEIAQLGNEEFVADELEDNGEKATLIWTNGEAKNIFAQIRFRSPNSSDVNQSGVLGDFASTFNDFISAYDDFAQHIDQALIWRPEFMNQTNVLDFDRFLSVSNVSNSEVILLNTQTVDDNWQVIFATDASVDQAFSYDIVYDDGHVNLSKTFNATVITSTPMSWVTPPYSTVANPVHCDGSMFWEWSGGNAPFQVTIGDRNEDVLFPNCCGPYQPFAFCPGSSITMTVVDNVGQQLSHSFIVP